MQFKLRLIRLLAFVMLSARPVNAQPPATRLAEGSTSLSHEFTRLISARELPNGLLLVIDDVEGGQLLALDFARNDVRQIGRKGSGPEEYRGPRRVYCTSEDSSLVDDPQLGRWMLLKGDRIVSTEVVANRFGYNPTLYGADSLGKVLELRALTYGQSPGLPRLPMHSAAESLLVILNDRKSSRRDTLARIRGGFRGLKQIMKPVAPGRAPILWIVRNPLAAEDQAIRFCDGWSAIVRGEPYSVEWFTPALARAARGTLPMARVVVDAAERKWATEVSHRDIFMPEELSPWPESLPAFLDDALLPLTDGRLAIRRVVSARAKRPIYDIVDRQARLSSRLELNEGEFVLAFGKQAVYIAATDTDGVQAVKRYRW